MMTPAPQLHTILRLRRLDRPTVYRVILAGELTHIRQFTTAQDAIDWAELYLPHQSINMLFS